MTLNFTRGLSNWTQGTATVANGSRTVSFSGASLISADPSNAAVSIYVAGEGDKFIVDGVGVASIASVDSASQITLDAPWPYASQTAVAYKIRRYNEVKTGEVAKYIQAAQTVGQDANPFVSFAIDDGVARGKLRETGGNIEVAVGPAGTADGLLKAAMRADPASGYASFPNGYKHNNPGFRNRVINGNFDIWQRGTTGVAGLYAFPVYSADRWIIYNSTGTSASFSKVSAPAGFVGQQAINVAATGVAPGGYVDIRQRNEGRQLADLDSKACALSFDLNASTSAGTLSGQVVLYANTALDNGTYSTVLFSANFTVPVGSNRVTVSIPAGNTAGLKYGADCVVRLIQNTSAGDVSVTLGAVQLEADPSGAGRANDFEFRPLPIELALCQRYAQLVGCGAVGKATGATTWQGAVPLRAPMRAAPTLSLISTTVTADELGVAARASSGSVLSADNVSATGLNTIGISGWSSLTAPNLMNLTMDCILASAEL